MKTIKYMVIRRCCLMEDEGRNFYVDTHDSRDEAEAWIAAQKGEYFSPGDYMIAEQVE